jgi:hypothetical protein
MNKIFIPSNNDFSSCDLPSTDTWSPAHYDTKSSKSAAVLAEIYSTFPEHLHDLIRQHSCFGVTVSVQLEYLFKITIEVLTFSQFCAQAKSM